MPQLTEFNADGILDAIKKVLQNSKLKLKRLCGIGSDNASVMTGVNNGVYVKLKQEVPHLILVKCIYCCCKSVFAKTY